MKEPELKQAVLMRVLPRCATAGETVVYEELILGETLARIDYALVNSYLHGFELKSEADSLKRLERQQYIYSRFFEKMTLVADVRHSAQALDMVPTWWGIIEAWRAKAGGVAFKVLRPAKLNPDIDPYILVTLLWGHEIIEELEALGLARGWRGKPNCQLWERFSNHVRKQDIRGIVKRRLLGRADCLAVPLQRLCDAMSRQLANQSGYPA